MWGGGERGGGGEGGGGDLNFCVSPREYFTVLNLLYTLFIPCGKFGPPYLRTALPSPTSACWVFFVFP